jgi:DNA-binding GntR family transcriptional regulator
MRNWPAHSPSGPRTDIPKKYGLKEKDEVVAYIYNLVLTGKLRTGDRVDRNEVARELGTSRVPVQEAIVQLEHDGPDPGSRRPSARHWA